MFGSKRELPGDIVAVCYRSREREKLVLERKLPGKTAAGGCEVGSGKSLCWRELSGDIAAWGYDGIIQERHVLERGFFERYRSRGL